MRATHEGTLNFAKKFSNYKDFYVKYNDLVFSKLGLGTFNKEPYKEENYLFSYENSVKESIENGINLIDTASNYRYGKSEKEIGSALKELMQSKKVSRDELIICSKGGFIQLDFPFPKNPYHWIQENIIDKNRASKDEIELDQHCMSADFLEWSCDKSLKNLGVDCIDIYFLHNPEMQLLTLGYEKFLKEVEKIFTRFESMSKKGKINYYGVASWNGFINDKNFGELINIEDLLNIAKKVGGEEHKFKFIQTPFNMAKTSIYTLPTQKVKGEECTLLQAAHRLGLGVISSSSLLQMKLFQRPFKPETGYLLDHKMHLTSDIQLALQFVRSTPGVISSLFASKEPTHVKQNLQIAHIKSVKRANYDLLYSV